MKALITAALAMFCAGAMATGTPPSPSSAKSSSAATSYGSAAGDAWAVALPGHGSPSYAGAYSICVQGKGILWNFAWSWSFDAECVRLIAELDRIRATPVPKPAAYPMAGTSGFSPADESAKADTVADCGRAAAGPAAAKGASKRPKTQTVAQMDGGCGK